MIIGITGTLGAGKGTAVEYLTKTRGFKHYSVRSFLTKIIIQRGLLVTREEMLKVGNELREQYGSGYIVYKLLLDAIKEQEHAVIESIRTVGEANRIKEHGGYLWAVDADITTRYERVYKRASATDIVSFEEFRSDERKEMENADITKPNIAAVIKMADVIFYNDEVVAEFWQNIEKNFNFNIGR